MESSSSIRKSAYGRTQLFLPSKDVIFREVKCMGGVTHHRGVHIYHLLPQNMHKRKREISCWHCCESMENVEEPIPLPRTYDQVERVYHVYGSTCSPECAKAYVIEHTTFDRGEHLNTLTHMLREVYSITTPIVETPPRPALLRFGGVFDPSKTRRRDVKCRVIEPPFVSYCMVAEEVMQQKQEDTVSPIPLSNEVEDEDTFEEPLPPALYDGFVVKKGEEVGSNPSSLLVKRRRASQKNEKERPTQKAKGPMSRFVKPTSSE